MEAQYLFRAEVLSLIALLKYHGYSSQFLSNWTRGLLKKERVTLFGFLALEFLKNGHFKGFLILIVELSEGHFVLYRSCSQTCPCCFSFFFLLPWVVYFPFLDFDFFFVLFLCFLVFLLLLQFFWSSPWLLGILGFVEQPSIMTGFPHYCWSYYRNWVWWLMMIFYPLLGADEVGGDVVVGDQFHNCCYWRSMNMCMAVTVIHTPIQFCFGLVFSFVWGWVSFFS